MKKPLKLHLQVQNHLKSLLAPGPAHLECRLQHRIADIYWEPLNLVFEIQCSPLSFDEAVYRTCEYQENGYHIVWLLHKQTFGKQIVGDAERYLLLQHAYYIQGTSKIFDQHQILQRNVRSCVSKPFYVDLTQPRFRREKLWGFRGDCRDYNKVRVQTRAAFQNLNPIQKFRTKWDKLLKGY